MGSFNIINNQIDVASIVSQLMEYERQPVYKLEDRVASMQTKVNEYQKFNTILASLANSVNMMLYGTSYSPLVALSSFNDRLNRSVFSTSTAVSSNENVLTATSFAGLAAAGSYAITVSQIARAQTTVSKGYESATADIGNISNGTITQGGKTAIVNLAKQSMVMSSGEFDDPNAPIGVTGEIALTWKDNGVEKSAPIQVDPGMSWEDVAQKIYIQTDGALNAAVVPVLDDADQPTGKFRLEITAAATGSDGAFTITTAGNDSDFLENIGFTQTREAKDTTLRDLQQAINEAAAREGLNINALLVNTGTWDSITNEGGYRLMIVSKETGTANSFELGGELADPNRVAWDSTQSALDAKLTINGIDISSSTNTVNNAIEGVTINIKNITQPGETVNLELGVDNDAIVASIKDVIAAYNEVATFINSQFTFNATMANMQNASDYIKSQFQLTEGSSGVLFGESTLRSVQSTLQSIVMGSAIPLAADPNSPYRSIRDLGITANSDGTLSLDENQLKKALANDFDRTAKFFLGYETDGGERVGGMLSKLGESLKGLTDPLKNPIKTATDGLSNTINDLLKSIDAYELRLQAREDLLYAQYQAANEALINMQVLLASITSSLASITNNNNNK